MEIALEIIASPIIALQLSEWLNMRKEKRRRRHDLFQSLMLTRVDLGHFGQMSPEHVRALNLIEIEFYRSSAEGFFDDPRSEAVIAAWKNVPRASKYAASARRGRRLGQQPPGSPREVARGDGGLARLLLRSQLYPHERLRSDRLC
jgi:hypothetical protein